MENAININLRDVVCEDESWIPESCPAALVMLGTATGQLPWGWLPWICKTTDSSWSRSCEAILTTNRITQIVTSQVRSCSREGALCLLAHSVFLSDFLGLPQNSVSSCPALKKMCEIPNAFWNMRRETYSHPSHAADPSFAWSVCMYVCKDVLQRRRFYPFNSFISGSTALCCALAFFFSFVIFFTQTVGLLVRGISPSQGRYLQTGQHKQRRNEHRHLCLEWDSNARSQRSSERRQFMP
jgi:hypothetical protein